MLSIRSSGKSRFEDLRSGRAARELFERLLMLIDVVDGAMPWMISAEAAFASFEIARSRGSPARSHRICDRVFRETES